MSSLSCYRWYVFFFFNDTATTEIYTLSLHDALPISRGGRRPRHAVPARVDRSHVRRSEPPPGPLGSPSRQASRARGVDRKSTRLNSSHANISYAVFCLKKKKKKKKDKHRPT